MHGTKTGLFTVHQLSIQVTVVLFPQYDPESSTNLLAKTKMVFSLQTLGSELLVRTLNGEPIDNKLITTLFFGDTAQHKEDAS